MTSKLWIRLCIVQIAVSYAIVWGAELRPFTSRDAAEMAYFGNIFDTTLGQPYDDGAVSPDGRFAIKITHRGVLSEGVVEGTIWLFDVNDVIKSIEDPDIALAEPIILARMSAAVNGYSNDFANRGNILLQPKWSNDGKSIFFLGRDRQENRQLFAVDVHSRELNTLSPADRDVFSYSASGPHIAFLAGRDVDSEDVWRTAGNGADDIVVGTGTALNPLLFPNFREYANEQPLKLEVWRVLDGIAEPLHTEQSEEPLQVVSQFANADISISPDGTQAVATNEYSSNQQEDSDGSKYRIIDVETGNYRDSADLEMASLSWIPFASKSRNTYAKIHLTVSESLNSPPVFVATKTGTENSLTIFDPNPQLAELELLPVNRFEWKDKHGNTSIGGLIKPADFDEEKAYPLVIQTHGFNQSRFFRVGFSETASAGRAIASRNIVVLQVAEPYTGHDTPIDLEKAGMDTYVAAIDELTSRGIIDPERVGISGYSFTGLTVATSIVRAPDRFAAAVIANADPLTLTGYYSYVDSPLHGLVEEMFVGAPPIDDGLQIWLEKSPSLSTSSITSPVLVSATDPFHLLSLWDFYAALRYQGKAVELQYIRSGQHNIAKPLHRVAHQEMIVDWFDFWLNRHEVDDPSKADQYRRWREMR